LNQEKVLGVGKNDKSEDKQKNHYCILKALKYNNQIK
jgi:hypothetical protein